MVQKTPIKELIWVQVPIDEAWCEEEIIGIDARTLRFDIANVFYFARLNRQVNALKDVLIAYNDVV
ncbi:MAG: hypothetical protein A2Y14_04195 [Verrucomicrobia bacterium GWF2_51_19]|nr:MAG: hypothetical protein A2Y14_04195 [Verrucomicrobia bacterium GWF2_51_19]